MKSYDGAVGNASEANPSVVGYFAISTNSLALPSNLWDASELAEEIAHCLILR